MNRQQIANRVYNHIIKQGEPSVNAGNTLCAYRGGEKGNLKCAAGIFIIEYNSDIEGLSWPAVVNGFPGCIEPGLLEHEVLISEMQQVHDTASYFITEPEDRPIFLQHFKRLFKELCYRMELEYPGNDTGVEERADTSSDEWAVS